MAVVQCSNGHYYDDSKYNECPHCKNGLKKIKSETFRDNLDELKTQGIFVAGGNDDNGDATVNLLIGDGEEDNEGRTVGLYNFEDGTKLVVGWLVCVHGVCRGRDYRIFHGWNKVGRGMSMDIYIPEDKKISAENQAAIIFDDKSGKFYCSNDYGNLTYLNGVHLTKTEILNSGDEIAMGDNKFIFIAFCTEDRKWQDEEK